MKKRFLAVLLSLVLVLGMLPSAALAAETEGNDSEQTEIVVTDTSTEDTISTDTGAEEPADNPTEEVTAPDQQEIPTEPTIDEQLAALIAALPDPEDIDPGDEDQVKAVYNQIAEIYAFAEENDIDVEDNEIINAVIAALYPTEVLEEDTHTLTLDYTNSLYYDSSKISSIHVKSIGEKSVSSASSYQVAEGAKVVVEVTYAANAGNAMVALAYESADETLAGLKTTQDDSGKACKTFYFTMPAYDTKIVLYGLTYWAVENNTITISGSGSMPDFDAPSWGGDKFAVYSPFYAEYHESITSARICQRITRTGNYTFANFTELTSISLPEGLTTVGWYLIRACTKVISITLPESVTKLEGGAFQDASGLKTIQTGNASLSDGTFNIQNITTLGNSVFQGTGVVSIMLSEGVTSLGQQMFNNCSSLETIGIPATVKTIGKNVFAGCSEGLSIYYGGTKSQWEAIDVDKNGNDNLTKNSNTLYFYSENSPTRSSDFDPTLNYYHIVDGMVTKWVICSIELISQDAVHSYLYGEENGTVTLPDLTSENVEGKKTFAGWYSNEDLATAVDSNNLKAPSVTLSSETSIYYAKWETAKYNATYTLNGGAIDGVSEDTYKVTVGYGEVLTSLTPTRTNYVFGGWYSDPDLTDAYDFKSPVSSEVILLYAKWNNPSGTWGDNITWELDPSTGVLTLTGSGSMKNEYTSTNYPWYAYQTVIQAIVIGEGITSIGYQAFDGKTATNYQNVTSITLPSTLKSLGQGCFRGMSGLKTINSSIEGVFDLRNTEISTIDGAAFYSETNLKAILLPDTLTSIGSQALASNSNLIAVQIPISCTTVGDHLCMSCSNLKVIYLSGTETTWEPTLTNNVPVENAAKAYLNGGSLPDTISVDGLSNTLLTPIKDSCIFGGWYSDSSLENKVEEYSTVTAKNTYYAKWTEDNGYSINNDNKSVTLNVLTYGYDSASSTTVTVSYAGTSSGQITQVSSSNNAFMATASGLNVTITAASGLDAGTYKGTIYVYTDNGATHWIDVSLTVSKAGSTVTSDPNTQTVTYGSTVILKVTTDILKTGSRNGIALLTKSAPEVAPNQVNFYNKDTLLGTAFVSYADDSDKGTATLMYDTTQKGLTIGSNTVTAYYGGNSNLEQNSVAGTITVILNPKAISKPAANSTTFTYNGEEQTYSYSAVPSNNYTVSGNQQTNAGTYTVTVALTDKPYTVWAGTPESSEDLQYTFTIQKATQTAPGSAPTMSGNSSNSITLNTVAANDNGATAEYSKDGGTTWQSSPVFTGLSSGTSYTFAVRYAETANYKASPASTTAIFSTTSGGSSSDGSHSGGTGGSTSYAIIVESSRNGDVSANRKSAAQGATVIITVKPDSGYELANLAVTDKNGKELELTDLGDGKYSFRMPNGKVIVNASFTAIEVLDPVKDCPKDDTCPAAAFDDVNLDAWYHDGVHYCIAEGLMNGTGETTFEPESATSRAMLVTVLYRLEGKPKVGENTFTDVADGEWYTDAIAWAAENKIVEGYGNGKFGPTDSITREQFATILYRYAKYKGYDVTATADITTFVDGSDTADWAEVAMAWAVAEKLINGIGNNQLAPHGSAVRAQMATILYRYMA